MKTKQEVTNFLESKVGTKVPCKGNASLDGQCVTLIKSLMEFLGVPDPYKARGHAKTVISAYLSEGIAQPGTGFISVFSNKNIGGGYGHIWCNAGEGDGVFYESNGVKPLTVTKGKTYEYDAVCNFDKYIGEKDMNDDMMEIKKSEFTRLIDEANAKDAEIKKLKTDVESLNKQLSVSADKLSECQQEMADHQCTNENIGWIMTGKKTIEIINGKTVETSFKPEV